MRWLPVAVLGLMILAAAPVKHACAAGVSSTNVPLDSPLYDLLRKLAGFGLIDTDVAGLKPFSRSEAARLVLEAEKRAAENRELEPFAQELLDHARSFVTREAGLYNRSDEAPLLDFHPFRHARSRMVYLAGVPRSYDRTVYDPGNQSVFGFIGGNLRPSPGTEVHMSGTEGTPLLENNEGTFYRRGFSGDALVEGEAYLSSFAAGAVEPRLVVTGGDWNLYLNKAYLTIGSGGAALEVGRDAAWFGPGYRGTTTLTNNAQNFDAVRLWSPEPIDIDWLKKYIGHVKYALIFSRFDRTGEGESLRRPYFLGAKLAVRPNPIWEAGINFVRQAGGPGFRGGASSSWMDTIFGGGKNDRSNTIAGIDLRFRIPQLRNTELYVEYSGEDSASFWPFVESCVAGLYIPRLTADGRSDLRLEYFWGSRILYTDWQFPAGYVYRGMSPGHSQGGATQDVFLRYGRWFSPRNHLALEYIHTERGNEGRVDDQTVETKNAGRIIWSLPLAGDVGLRLMYGVERVHAMNLIRGNDRVNHIVTTEISYPQ